MEYLVHIGILIGIYLILGVSLDLIAGHTGMLSLAHAAFYGIGAYAAAILALRMNVPFPVSVALCMTLGALLGIVLGALTARIRDDYFVVATLALQVVVLRVFKNCIWLTGGSSGLIGIPEPAVGGYVVSSDFGLLLLVGLACCLTVFVSGRIVGSPLGRVLIAIREDEIVACCAGKNVLVHKLTVLAVGGAFAAGAGALYAHYVGFIDPTSFTLMESIFVLSIVIIGGAGTRWGPVVGAAILVTLPEVLRFVGLPGSMAGEVRQILYGGLLVVFVMWRPQGLMGARMIQRGGVQE